MNRFEYSVGTASASALRDRGVTAREGSGALREVEAVRDRAGAGQEEQVVQLRHLRAPVRGNLRMESARGMSPALLSTG